jgi:hypothetical protein
VSSPNRLILQTRGDIDAEKQIQLQIIAAWEWFEHQALNSRSVCGLSSKLAVHGVLKDESREKVLDQLRFKSVLPIHETKTADLELTRVGEFW